MAAFFASCEEDFAVDTNDFVPSIVVNSMFTADSTWIVNLTTSKNIYDVRSKSVAIEDAYVIITEPNGQKSCVLTHSGGGLYTSNLCFPANDKSYNLYINSPLYGQVTSSSSLPKKAEIVINSVNDEADATVIDFTIKDQSALNNFYIWDLVTVKVTSNNPSEGQSSVPGARIDVRKWIKDLSKDIIYIKNQKLYSSLSSTDGSVDGGLVNSTLIANKSIFQQSENPDGGQTQDEYKTMLRVMTVSEELYQYFKSIEDYLAYEDFQSSISEPTSVYSNIRGGVGIFAGYSVEYKDIK